MRVVKSIEAVRRRIRLLESLDSQESMTEEIKTLRNDVLYLHSIVEYLMETFIDSHTVPKELEKTRYRLRVYGLLTMMDYSKKLNYIEKMEILPKPAIKNLRKLNNYRLWFAHQKSFSDELKSLRNQATLEKVYSVLGSCYEAMMSKIEPFKLESIK